MAQWKFNIQGETLTGAQQLKVGTFPYLIKSAKMEIVKSNPTGKEQAVVVELQQGEDYSCKLYLKVMSDDAMVAGIADKTVRSLAVAAGVRQFTSLGGKYVNITAVEKAGTGKNADKKYVNVLKVEPVESEGEEETETEEEPEEKPKTSKKPAAKPEPEEDESEDESEGETEDEPEPEPVKKKARPW